MSKEEFVLWLESSSYQRDGNGDDYWRELVDYTDYVFDYVEIEGDKVVFKYEEYHWGYTSCEEKRYSFEEFIDSYENYTLK